MEIGVIGLGKMGAGMARRLARAGVHVICHDNAQAAKQSIEAEPNVDCAQNLAALCARLGGERLIVIMLPAGEPVENTIRDLLPLLSSGDTLVDGGNSYYRDSKRRALGLSQQGLRYIDAGVSGGVYGLEQGFCLMLGGTARSIEIFEPFAKILAPHAERGWLHCGPSGAGHYAKMIHNGIEYAMMQALAEGFALLAARPELDIDTAARRDLAARQRGALMAARPGRRHPERERESERRRAGGSRLGRRPLDRARIDRAGRADTGDHDGAHGALLQPGARRLRAPAAGDDARALRRPRRPITPG
jgi:6-phosphogluconate dehydrogenase (decarboxylating)